MILSTCRHGWRKGSFRLWLTIFGIDESAENEGIAVNPEKDFDCHHYSIIYLFFSSFLLFFNVPLNQFSLLKSPWLIETIHWNIFCPICFYIHVFHSSRSRFSALSLNWHFVIDPQLMSHDFNFSSFFCHFDEICWYCNWMPLDNRWMQVGNQVDYYSR